jgi:3-keto-5-aminohexanoate cleavage enzyme
MPDPVIVELAVNGATPRSRNRHAPRDPGEIAEVARADVELGASIVHSHNDEPMFTPDGVHAVEPYLASWRAARTRAFQAGPPAFHGQQRQLRQRRPG